MSSSQDPFDLDQFLDGTMSNQERDKAAREIASNPQLRSEVELQKQIDASLRQVFVAPAMPDSLASLLEKSAPTNSNPPSPTKFFSRRIVIGITTAVILVVWGKLGWDFLAPYFRSNPTSPPPSLTLIYQSTVSAGFQPPTLPKNDRDFSIPFYNRLGQGLRSKTLTSGIKIDGLGSTDECIDHCGGMSQSMVMIFAHVQGSPVMVFANRAGSQQPTDPAPDSKLHQFRKELGPLVLYEVTPHDQPHLLDSLTLVDINPLPKQGEPANGAATK